MAIGDVFKVAAVGEASGNEMITTWHFRMLSSADPGATIGAYLTTEWAEIMQAQQSSLFQWDKLEVRQLAIPPTGVDYATGYPLVGAQSSTMGDFRSAIVASLRTAFLGRSYRGRQYLPGFPQDAFVDGLVEAGLKAYIQSAYDDILAGVGVGGSNTDILWGVWSPALGQTPPPPGHPTTAYDLTAGFHGITDVIVNADICTQRRRGLGV